MSHPIKLEEGEAILYTARKHWFIFSVEILFTLVLAGIPLLFFLVPTEWYITPLKPFLPGNDTSALFMFSWSLWLLLLWIIVSVLWTDYYLDVWLITNHRIIDVEQLGMFNRKISDFRYEQVQDVTVEVPGVLATFIDFGTVEIRTASNEVFSFKGVAYPNLLKEKIMAEHHRVHSSPS